MSTLEVPVSSGRWRARVREFFYQEEAPYGLAIVRILLPVVLFFAMAFRWSFARELFSTDGAPTPLWENYGHPGFLPLPSGTVAVAIESALLLALLTSACGWCTRISLILATAGYVYLNMLDTISTVTKYSAIAANVMFLLCLSQCGDVWSVDNWLRRTRLRRAGAPANIIDHVRRSPAWSRRLMQLMFAAIYFGAAVTKVHTPAFFTGEQLRTWMITDYNYPNLLGSRFAMHPSILIIFGYISVVWEILFAFQAWRGLGRIVMISLGVVFHVMTWLTLGLYAFPLVCITSYFCFLNERDVDRMRRLLGRWQPARDGSSARIGALLAPVRSWKPPALRPAWSHSILAVLVVVTAGGGIALEHRADLYGLRRPEGPYRLEELETEYVAKVIAATPRIENEDKVLSFDVGSIVVGGAVLDRRTEFRQGETVRAQCALIPPHEDLWLQCNLYDSQNRVVQNTGIVINSEGMRATFHYVLGDCVSPGEYALILKIAGEEIMRRPIKVLPRSARCVAN